MTNPHGITVSTRPGGLSSGAHAVNVLITLCTGGFWIVPYMLIVMAQPARVVVGIAAPPGTPPEAIEAARREAVVPSVEERKRINGRNLALGIVALVLIIPPIWFLVAVSNASMRP